MEHINHKSSPIPVRDSKWNQLWTEWLRKVCAIILNHRIASFQNDHQHRRKSSTWFNINVKENEKANIELDGIIRRHRRSSGGISMHQQQRQQQQQQREAISVFLDIFIDNLHRPSAQTNRQRSVSAAASNLPDEQKATEKSKHAKVLLERWHLHVTTTSDGTDASGQKFNETKLHTSYKKSTVMMRSLLSFVVLMPCFQLFEKKRRSMDSVKHLSNIRYVLYEDITRSTSNFEQGSTSKFIFSPIELSDHHSIELDVQYRSNLKSVMMMDRDNISEMKRQGLRSHQIIFDFFDGADNKKPDERQSTSIQQRVSRRRSIKSQLRMTEDNDTPASFSPLLQDDDEDSFTRRQRSMSSPSPYHQRPPLHSNTGTPPIPSQKKQHPYQEQQQQLHHLPVARSPSISTGGDEQTSLLTQQLLQHSKQQQQHIPHTPNDEQNSTTTQESDGNRQSNEQRYTHPLQLPSSVSPSFGSIPIARSNSSTYSISPPPFKDLVDSGSSSWKRKFNIRFSPIIDSPLNSYHLPAGYHYPNTPRESFYDGDELIPDDDSDDEQMESVESGEPSSYFQDPSRLVPSIFVKVGRTGEDEKDVQSQNVQETKSDYSRSIVSQYQIPSFLIYDDQRDTSKFSGSSDSHTRTDSANIDDEDALMLMMMGEHSGYSSGNANKLLFEMDETSGDDGRDTSALVSSNKKPQQRKHFKSLLTELEDAKLKFFAHENRDKITRSVSDIIRESDDWIAKKTELLSFHAK